MRDDRNWVTVDDEEYFENLFKLVEVCQKYKIILVFFGTVISVCNRGIDLWVKESACVFYFTYIYTHTVLFKHIHSYSSTHTAIQHTDMHSLS